MVFALDCLRKNSLVCVRDVNISLASCSANVWQFLKNMLYKYCSSLRSPPRKNLRNPDSIWACFPKISLMIFFPFSQGIYSIGRICWFNLHCADLSHQASAVYRCCNPSMICMARSRISVSVLVVQPHFLFFIICSVSLDRTTRPSDCLITLTSVHSTGP